MTDATDALATVTGQLDTVIAGPNNRPLQVIRVSFRTRSGELGSVDVPKDGYSADAVREAVRTAAQTLEDVHGLQVG